MVQHGQTDGGQAFPRFSIDVPNGERVVKVEGYVGSFDGTTEIVGIRFATNRNRISRIYGHASSFPFTFQAPPNGQIYAPFGRNGLFGDALGVRKSVP